MAVKNVAISCPAGQKALGGGALIVAGTASPAELQIVAIGGTYPTPAFDGWHAVAWETGAVMLSTWSVTVYVLCATVT